MRVNKEKIINSIADYIENNIIPAMADDRGMQVILYAAIKAVKTNNKLIDTIIQNPIIKTLIDDDGTDTYDIDALFSYIENATDKFGYFPIYIKPIPLISPTEKTLRFTSNDIKTIRKQIGGTD